jgi:hypothetical protein
MDQEIRTIQWYRKLAMIALALCLSICLLFLGCSRSEGAKTKRVSKPAVKNTVAQEPSPKPAQPKLDTALYNALMLRLSHDTASARWPVKGAYPLPGAILPFKRIIAYYGNFYSRNMGILGELDPDIMLKHLQDEVRKWELADTEIPVVPAIHYIAVTAQSRPGQSGKYRMRMPFSQIDKALELAKKINGIVFLDVQVGWGSVQEEIPALEPYLKLPNVHLAIDPEFSMKDKRVPGSIIGTYDAADINYVSGYLTKLVKQYGLPPKVLIVHRFTRGMVTNYKQIELRPEVQIVMHMDGWGFPAKKVSSYRLAIVTEPVQFTGFKLFYKNDIKTPPWLTIMKPQDVLKLNPRPIYIQYQ